MLVEIVGAVEAVRQMIGEDRQHDVERVAQEMDDRRLRENQADQAEMRLVERHLVGEPAGALRIAPSWRARCR